ncbi:recombinase family protein [Sphingomonas sp. TF3]|uniref:recombinase family protein n=1 Tax=Sphingomonas sp. TF3 TaxID=2495580 RepID=UPI00163C5C1E
MLRLCARLRCRRARRPHPRTPQDRIRRGRDGNSHPRAIRCRSLWPGHRHGAQRKRDSRPRGGRWSASTINGNKSRGTGILNNPLYIGRPEHLRHSYRKDPESGARHAFRNAEDQRQTVEVPHLRIISDASWERVKARQALVAHGPRTTGNVALAPFWSKQRPKYLLTGKLKCGEAAPGTARRASTAQPATLRPS